MRTKQEGLATVEFAIIGALLLLVLLAVIEFGRLVFVWNSVTEATRRGVRVAVVCPVNDPAIRNVTVFNDDATAGPSALLTNLSTANVTVRYLDAGGDPLNCNVCNCDDTCGDHPFVSIKYVEVRIDGYQHNLLLPPPFNLTLTVPAFESTLPRESLGVVPGVGTQCNFS
jgi:hypothetical protein